MSWRDRLAEDIQFISPSGRTFSALWRGDNRSKSKKLGEFSPPKRKGTIFQDLDVTAVRYPLTFIFDGDNHDLEASLFFETCSENGTWAVIHPIHGALDLQLSSITQKDQPITTGNYTEIESEWFEPIIEDTIISSSELASEIERQIEALNQAAADQLAGVTDQSRVSRIQALKNAAQSAIDTISNGMAAVSELSADIARITNAIQRATTTDLLNPVLALNSLATQIQNAAQTPMLATSNVNERVRALDNVFDIFLSQDPDTPSEEAKNELAIKELSLASLTASFSRVVITSELTTRQEALNLAENLSSRFDEITNSLDQNQQLFINNLLINRYFSQSQSYSDILKLISLSLKYLIITSFDLRIEKKFTLDRDRTPIDIAISEYGELGENDENLDFFLLTNNLKNKEILLLNAGKEVVVYV